MLSSLLRLFDPARFYSSMVAELSYEAPYVQTDPALVTHPHQRCTDTREPSITQISEAIIIENLTPPNQPLTHPHTSHHPSTPPSCMPHPCLHLSRIRASISFYMIHMSTIFYFLNLLHPFLEAHRSPTPLPRAPLRASNCHDSGSNRDILNLIPQ